MVQRMVQGTAPQGQARPGRRLVVDSSSRKGDLKVALGSESGNLSLVAASERDLGHAGWHSADPALGSWCLGGALGGQFVGWHFCAPSSHGMPYYCSMHGHPVKSVCVSLTPSGAFPSVCDSVFTRPAADRLGWLTD